MLRMQRELRRRNSAILPHGGGICRLNRNGWRTEARRHNANTNTDGNACPLCSALCAEHVGRYTINANCGVRLKG